MKVKELAEDDKVLMWFEVINCEETTKATYLQALKYLTDMTGKTPAELIREAKIEKKTLDMEDRSINLIFIKLRSQLQDKGLAPVTIRSRLTGITSFYSAFNLETPKLRQRGKKAKTLKENRRKPEMEDLRKALKVTDAVEAAILLTGFSSGLSCIDITKLMYSDYKKGYDPETGLCLLELERTKTQVDFKTLLSKEATDAINVYLEWRNRKPATGNMRRIKQISKQAVTEDSFLFIKRDVPDKYLETKDEDLRQLTRNSVLKMYRSISERAGLSTEPGAWNLLRSHSVRRAFNSRMLEAGCPTSVTERFMGHDLGVQEGYLQLSDAALKDIYARYQPYLTVNKQMSVTESPDYQKIKDENDILRAEAARTHVERTELEELKRQFEEMNQTYAEMFENIEPDPVTAAALKKHRLVLLPDDED